MRLENFTIYSLNISRNASFNDTLSNNHTARVRLNDEIKPIGVFFLIVAAATIVVNAGLLSVFVRMKELWTSFNIYLISLSICNILAALFTEPLLGVRYFTNAWPLGRLACSAFLVFSDYVISFDLHVHLLICANRFCAVIFPISYKNYHSKRLAQGLCIALWIYLSLWLLPFGIMDHLYYREDSELDCVYNYEAQPQSIATIGTACFFVPPYLTIGVYLLVMLQIWRKNRFKRKLHNGVMVAALTNRPAEDDKSPGAVPAESPRTHTTGTLATGQADKTINLEVRQLEPKPEPVRRSNRKTSSSPRNHFRLLSVLTVIEVIFWSPNAALSVIQIIDPECDDVRFGVAINVMYVVSSVINPFLYAFFNNDWKDGFKTLWHLK